MTASASFYPARNRSAAQAPSPTRNESSLGDVVLAGGMVFVLILAGIVAEPQMGHWFILPLSICGTLTATPLIAWLRGRLDSFDSKAIVAGLWFLNSFLAPLLHIVFDWHSPLFGGYVPDWREWFGWMAFLNALGLSFFYGGHYLTYRMTAPAKTVRVPQSGRFLLALTIAILVSAAAAALIQLRYGALRQDELISPTTHLSWIIMLADPLFLLLLTGAVYWMQSVERRRSFVVVGILLMTLLVAQALFLGLRGSRSAILTPVFIGTVMCHYLMRRIPVGWVIAGAMAIGVGGYFYGYYKRFGTEGLAAVQDARYRDMLAHRAGISPLGVVLGSLSRAEVQAFLLYRSSDPSTMYIPRKGKTYVSAGLTLIPRAVWPTKPTESFGKVAAGTDLQYGEGRYRPGVFQSSLVYGLAGEAILNFGAAGVPLMYGVFGVMLGWYRRKANTLSAGDARLYCIPAITFAICIAALGDADNTIFSLLKNGTLLIAVTWFGSYAIKRSFPSPRTTSPFRAQS